MKKIYGKASHSFYYFLFLPTSSITVLKMEKKYGKVSHNFSIIYIYYEILHSNYLLKKIMVRPVTVFTTFYFYLHHQCHF